MERLNAETAGADYLTALNFRNLIEWITAESLLARPTDPIAFIQTLCDKKLNERDTHEGYKREAVTSYLKECYATATATANATTLGSSSSSSSSVPPAKVKSDLSSSTSSPRVSSEDDEEENDESRSLSQPQARTRKQSKFEIAIEATGLTDKQRLDVLDKIIRASCAIAMQLDPSEATHTIISETCNVLQADRATLFTVDKTTEELVINVAEGAKDIRLPMGKGIAGTVALTGETIKIDNCYSDPRFDPANDIASGYKTHTMLCIPVKNGHGEIVGVMQAINKQDKTFFDPVDEEMIGILAAQAGIALHNSFVHRLAIKSREKVSSLLQIIHAMHSDLGITSLMFTITRRIRTLVDSDRSTFFLVDKKKEELWAVQGEVNIRIPISKGIVGVVAQSGETVNIRNAYDDPRFSKAVDLSSGYKTNTILAMPLLNQKHEVIGVLQLINKTEGFFDQDDEEILSAFLNIAGPILQNSQLFVSKEKESGNEFSGKEMKSSSSRDVHETMNHITEGDSDCEEEEDE